MPKHSHRQHRAPLSPVEAAAGVIHKGERWIPAKAVARPVVNASTAGIGAPVVSTAEDAGAVALSVTAIAAPILVVVVLVAVFVLLWWLWKRSRAWSRDDVR